MSLYFAYGSNLDRQDWSQFCARHDADPQCMKPIEPALLPDVELVFNHRSARREGGALNIRPRRGQVVRGALFEVNEDGWRLLDLKESVAVGSYVRTRAVAILRNGQTMPVVTYMVRPERTEGFVAPSVEYNEAVRRGLSGHGWTSDQYDQVAQGLAPETDVEGLFVYGTLMRGQCRSHAIDRHEPAETHHGHTRGRLHETAADYPMLDLVGEDCDDGGGGNDVVHGEFVRFRNLEVVLETIDEVEEFFGYASADNEYVRTVVDVNMGSAFPSRAWTYAVANWTAIGPRIESGCWRTFTGAQSSQS